MMRAALVVNQVTRDGQSNLKSIVRWASKAADAGSNLVLFPEAALTGLVNNDDPSHDLPLGQTIPGPVTRQLANLARVRSLYLGLGLLERDGQRLYDSAILIGPQGDILLKYRRMQPQWHGREADPSVYCEGDELSSAETIFGRVVFLICGDLFDDATVQRLYDLKADWLLFPFARCFPAGVSAEDVWESAERQEYAKWAMLTKTTALMTNYFAEAELGGGAFGGAMVVSPCGEIVASLPVNKPGILLVDLQIDLMCSET